MSPAIWFLVTLSSTLLIVTYFARPFDVTYALSRLHLPAVICGFGVFVAMFSGAIRHLRSAIGISLVALIGWMAITTAFSSWKGGSADYVLWYIAYWVVFMLVIAQAVGTIQDVIRICYITAGCSVFYLLYNVALGRTHLDEGGRFTFGGTFGNSNDLALLLGFAIPFVSLFATRLRNPFAKYSILVCLNGYLIITLGQTASRTSLLALTCMAGVYFLRAEQIQKLGFIVLGLFAVVGLAVTLPQSTLERLSTIGDSFVVEQTDFDTEAMQSTAERRDLLIDALRMAWENPIFGVGAGQYSNYRYDNFKTARGENKRWRPSHNTYAQVAAETGIPGFILFVAFLAFIYRTILKIQKFGKTSTHPHAEAYRQVGLCLEAAFIYYAVFAFFLTADRYPQVFLLAGLVIGMDVLRKTWESQALPLRRFASSPITSLAGGVGRGVSANGASWNIPRRSTVSR